MRLWVLRDGSHFCFTGDEEEDAAAAEGLLPPSGRLGEALFGDDGCRTLAATNGGGGGFEAEANREEWDASSTGLLVTRDDIY